MDAETKQYLDTKVAELLTELNAGFDRLGRRPSAVEAAPGDRRTDGLRDIRWELATLRNRVAAAKNEAAAAKNELAAIQHTLSTLENRLKDMERGMVA